MTDLPTTNPEDYDGTQCPVCLADDIQPDTHHLCFDDGIIRLHVHCLACRARWTEVYGLSGYRDLETPE